MTSAMFIPMLLGMAYAAAPGIVNTECLRQGVASGFRPAFQVQIGGLLGSGAWALLAFSGLAALSRAASLLDVIGLAGGIYLCKIALDAFRVALHRRSAGEGTREARPLRTGLIFGLANPAAVAFWSGVGGGVLSTRGDTGVTDLAWFMLAFLGGTLAWAVTFSSLASFGRRYARPRVFQIVDAACGAVIGFFGLKLVWGSARRLIGVL